MTHNNDGITRRDFLNGVSLGIAGSLAPIDLLYTADTPLVYYPPTLTGIRGNHPGSFDYAHKLAFGGSGRLSNLWRESDR